jgi:hypothetical protein
MDTIVDAVQDAIITEPEANAGVQAGAQGDDGEIENQLAEEITTLWGNHVRLSADRKTTAKELRQIRAALAERLYSMKSLLSRPGRGGEWRGWLRERKIPRTTADRLVARHAETVCADGDNVPSGAISKPTEADIIKSLYKVVWPHIDKALTTQRLVFMFLSGIAKGLDVRCEWRNEGLMLFRPDDVAATAATTQSTTEADAGAAGDASGSQVR